MAVQVNPITNNITIQNSNQTITVVDNDSANIIDVNQVSVNVIEVTSPGPAGPVGPSGSQGIQGPPGGTPGGSDTQIQFNSGGVFDGSSNLTFDYDLNSLVLTGSFLISSSNTFTNIGPSIFSGSVNVSSSLLLNNLPVLVSTDIVSFLTTSSFNNFTSSYNTSSFTGSFTGLLTGTSSYASQSLSSSYAQTASYVVNAQSASFVTTSQTASYVNLIEGPGIRINNLSISSSVLAVNGIYPINGNISTTLTSVITGVSASLIQSSSGTITGSLTNGTVWIISNNTPDPTKNGNAYIFASGSVGQWYQLSGYDTATYDSRYLKLTPQSPLAGNLDLGTNNIINVGTMFGTASWATNATNAPNYLLLSNTSSMLQPYVLSSNTSSFVQNGQTSSFVTNSQTSSFVKNSQTSSMTVATASYVTGSIFTSANPALSSSYAITASYALSSAGGSGVTINNNTNNNIITATGTANTLNGESNLTFDGSTLAVTGKVTATSFTGSLQGTSSWAETSSRAITASYALVSSGTIENAVTASYALRTQINLIQNYENGGNTSGTGNGETLVTYGYSAGTAASAFPLTNTEWGSISTSTTYDSCVWQEALLKFRTNKSSYIQSADDKRYIINHKIYIPTTNSFGSTNNPYMFGIDGRGCMIKDTRSGAEASGGLFVRVPINQSQANNYDVEYAVEIKNIRFYGPADPALSSSCAIEIGSSKRSNFENLDISRYDLGFRGSMMLNCTMNRINTIFCDTAGVKFEKGWWSGAGQATTVSQIDIQNSRFNTSLSSSIGLWLENCDSSQGDKLQFEGASGSYGLFYDSTSTATVIKNAWFRNLRFESETKYYALIGYKGRDTFSFIAELGWYQKTEDGAYLIETEAYTGSPIIVLSNWGFGSTDNTWKINNLNQGCAFDITNVRLSASNFGGSPRSPQTAAEILASSSLYFSTTVPTSNRLRFTPPIP